VSESITRILRLTGIAGIVASLCWTLGDALLLGTRVTADEYPILTIYAGSTGMASRVVQSGVQFFGSSPNRLAAGALVAVLTTPLYLAGVWHIYLALKPAGKWSSVGPLLLLTSGFAFAPFVHGSFYYIAELVKLLPLVDTTARAHVLDTATRATTVLFGTYAVLALVTIAGFVWMIVTVARGRTLYPRWIAIANPIVLMIIGSLLDRVLPDPLALWLEGAGLSLGMLFFFSLSLALLWNERGVAAMQPTLKPAQ
jgi:Family of unknown function (DUF6796)